MRTLSLLLCLIAVAGCDSEIQTGFPDPLPGQTDDGGDPTGGDGGGSSEPDGGAGLDAGDAGDGPDAGDANDAGSGVDGGSSADAGTRCAQHSECGGNACVFGRCARVDEHTQTLATRNLDAIAIAYGAQGQPEVATVFAEGSGRTGYQTFLSLGPFDTRIKVSGDVRPPANWRVERRPLAATQVAWVDTLPGKYGIFVGPPANPVGVIFNDDERVGSFDVARNAAGDQFVAAVIAHDTRGCDVRFASRPKGGAWSTPKSVHGCASQVAIHLRADGTPTLLLVHELQARVDLLSQTSPLGWSATPLLPAAGEKPLLQVVRPRDGVALLVLHNRKYTTSLSYPDYDVKLLTLVEDRVTRTVPLGSFPAHAGLPFPSVDAQPDGTTWLLRGPNGVSVAAPVEVRRVDGATGTVTQQQLGTVVRKSFALTAFAVSAEGELSVLHSEDGFKLMLRRLSPY